MLDRCYIFHRPVHRSSARICRHALSTASVHLYILVLCLAVNAATPSRPFALCQRTAAVVPRLCLYQKPVYRYPASCVPCMYTVH
jgi:hypothetical protein